MGAATSKDMAAAVLVPLPFNIITMALRFWIRTQRKAWGPDDWAMTATIPVWVVSQVGLIGMAWSGVGQLDVTLTEQQRADSYFWFYVFQEFWCFTLVALKWSLGFTLLRIANGQRWVQVVIYTCLALVTVCTGGTGMYLFFQCSPVEKNWHQSIEGTCQPREIQTALSFLVAAVSISTDWIFAVLPFALIWKLQMANRVKASVIGLLGLGFFASIAPIVRLKYLLLMNDTSKFLQALGIILAWAQAEVGIGMLVANLPACRPLLERALSRLTSFTGSKNKSSKDPATSAAVKNSYLELGERDTASKKTANASRSGVETRVYGRDMDGNSSESLPDDHSQKQIVSKGGLGAIRVQREFGMEVEKNRGGNIV
ncbi:cation-transporting atpase 4 [Colletotrichum truncatum]|uniref:Cation-transporting atpase 4 n=1 Tax=Colletotrichum truncatum TaxID=5467 RepID=A0ACC3YYP8_COLTU|nr:cation-transporting atpase 4 [Colletotrichum truncatum]KAF6782015.1 cation-transporting atpase 4 [Colletotrichum truncatum]